MIIAENLQKSYGTRESSTRVLKGIDLTINKGEFVAVMGPSGSGKSTLLNLIGGIDKPDKGKIIINKKDIGKLNQKKGTLFRRNNIGFVFQSYQLLPNLNVEENISLPMHSAEIEKVIIKQRVMRLIHAIGLFGREKSFPSQLSGGQQQRVSIARALSMQPEIILADEPTGNLDRKTSKRVLEFISNLHKDNKLTIVMVTHDIYTARYADRIILLKDGFVEADMDLEGEGADNALDTIMEKLNT